MIAAKRIAKKNIITSPVPSSKGSSSEEEEEQTDDPDDEHETGFEQDSQALGSQPSSKRRRADPLHLNDEQTVEIAEWLQQHDYIYIKSRVDFRKKAKKDFVWAVKATEMLDHTLERC